MTTGIPSKFCNKKAEGYPVVVNTVRDLKLILGELPDDLPINQDYSAEGGAIVTVFNVDSNSVHLCLRENGTEEDY